MSRMLPNFPGQVRWGRFQFHLFLSIQFQLSNFQILLGWQDCQVEDDPHHPGLWIWVSWQHRALGHHPSYRQVGVTMTHLWVIDDLSKSSRIQMSFQVFSNFDGGSPAESRGSTGGCRRNRENRNMQRFGQSCREAMYRVQLLWWTGLSCNGEVF